MIILYQSTLLFVSCNNQPYYLWAFPWQAFNGDGWFNPQASLIGFSSRWLVTQKHTASKPFTPRNMRPSHCLLPEKEHLNTALIPLCRPPPSPELSVFRAGLWCHSWLFAFVLNLQSQDAKKKKNNANTAEADEAPSWRWQTPAR